MHCMLVSRTVHSFGSARTISDSNYGSVDDHNSSTGSETMQEKNLSFETWQTTIGHPYTLLTWPSSSVVFYSGCRCEQGYLSLRRRHFSRSGGAHYRIVQLAVEEY